VSWGVTAVTAVTSVAFAAPRLLGLGPLLVEDATELDGDSGDPGDLSDSGDFSDPGDVGAWGGSGTTVTGAFAVVRWRSGLAVAFLGRLRAAALAVRSGTAGSGTAGSRTAGSGIVDLAGASGAAFAFLRVAAGRRLERGTGCEGTADGVLAPPAVLAGSSVDPSMVRERNPPGPNWYAEGRFTGKESKEKFRTGPVDRRSPPPENRPVEIRANATFVGHC
jgi:hypothetical protein